MTVLAVDTVVWSLAIPVVILWVYGLVDIFRRDYPKTTKFAWILIVVLLPIAGTLLYLVLRKPTQVEIDEAKARSAKRNY